MEPANQQEKNTQQKHHSFTSITSKNACKKISDPEQNKNDKDEVIAEMDASSTPTLKDKNEDVCWICLDAEDTERPLHSPCGCPRKVHELCLARWQLQKAGKDEEQHCRFFIFHLILIIFIF